MMVSQTILQSPIHSSLHLRAVHLVMMYKVHIDRSTVGFVWLIVAQTKLTMSDVARMNQAKGERTKTQRMR